MAQNQPRHEFLKNFQEKQSVFTLGDSLKANSHEADHFITTSKEFEVDASRKIRSGGVRQTEHTSAYCMNVPSNFKTIPFEYDSTARFTSEQAKATKYVATLQSNIEKAASNENEYLNKRQHDSIYATARTPPSIAEGEQEFVTTEEAFHGAAISRSVESKAEALKECGTYPEETGFTKAVSREKPILTDDVARYTSEIRKSQKYTLQPIRAIEKYAAQPEHKLMGTQKISNAFTTGEQIAFPQGREFETENQTQYHSWNTTRTSERTMNGNLAPQMATAFVENVHASGTTRPFELDPAKRYTSEMSKAMKYTKEPKPIGWF